MHIIVANNSLYTHVAGTTVFNSASTPAGVTTFTKRPCFSRYRKETVINGTFSPGVVWSETTASFRKLGFTAPAAAITIAAGSGTGITATCRAYLVPVEKSGTTIIGRGNPSPVSNSITLSDQGIAYSGIPATATDARTTHYEIYREDDGFPPRLDVTVTLGTTTASSNRSPTALSLETALPTTTSGVTDSLARGAPPYCLYNETYHDRTWYAGDPSHPQRVWFSRTGEMEAVRSTSWIDTRDGEAVTGIKRCGDQLVVFCAHCTYVIQGYSDGIDGATADLTMVKIAPDIGCISHFSIVNVGSPSGGDTLFFAAQEGVYSYNGSYFKYMMRDLKADWRESYINVPTHFDDAYAAFDHHWSTYKLGIPDPSGSFYYVAHLAPVWEGADQPAWVYDYRGRRDYSIGNLTTSTTGRQVALHTGSADGFLRLENQDLVGQDDGITKSSSIRTKHYMPMGPSGGINHGVQFTNFDLYFKNENQAATLDFFAGDEYAGDTATPSKRIDIPAGAIAGKVASGSVYGLLDGVVGTGLTLITSWEDGVDVQWKGFGISFKPGLTSRKSTA